MRRLTLGAPGPLHLLVVGAHADDIEIGAGATILRLLEERPGSSILWVVASATPDRAAEARASAAAFSAAAASVEVIVGDLPDGRLPAASTAVKDMLESVKARPYRPHPGARTSRTPTRTIGSSPRPCGRRSATTSIAAYEIPKYDGDLGRPNLFVDIDEATLQRKIDLLQAYYPSQHDRTWWGADTFRAIVRLRGIEAATRYAEAFYCRKLVL